MPAPINTFMCRYEIEFNSKRNGVRARSRPLPRAPPWAFSAHPRHPMAQACHDERARARAIETLVKLYGS